MSKYFFEDKCYEEDELVKMGVLQAKEKKEKPAEEKKAPAKKDKQG